MCTLGVETDATPSERAGFAELAATIGVRGISRTTARARPTDLRRHEDHRTGPEGAPVPSREPWLTRMMEPYDFSREATAAVLTLLGPPNRPHDDSRYAQREVADCLRVDEFLTSLQSENHMLLQALIDTYPGENGFTHHEPKATDLFRRAWRNALTWALRPRSWVVDGFGSLELEVARTVQSLRVPHRWSSDSEDPADSEKSRVPLERVDFGQLRALEPEPHVALAQAVATTDSDHPGMAVLGAALRWRDALDITEGRLLGWRPDGTVRVGGLTAPRNASPQVRAFQQRIRAWEETPWCRNRRNWAGHHLVPEARHLTMLPAEDDPLAEDIRLLLLHWQAHRGRRIIESGFGDQSAERLQRAGILWGTWPPPPGCLDDPMEGPDWALTKRVELRLGEGDWLRGKPSRLPDRIYHARLTGKDRIIASEPDGSHRVMRGHATGDPYFSLVYGGSGLETLSRHLVLDVLGPLALCPACWGGSVREWDAPGWCETCRGDGRHRDLHRAQSAVADAVNGREIEWDISRSKLLGAIVSADR